MAVVAQANPQLQTVKRQLPQTTEKGYSAGAPFIRLVKKMQTLGWITSIPADLVAHTFSPQLPAAPGFLRALSCTFSVAGGAGTGATYQNDAPFSWVNQVLFKDINNTTIYQVSGFELYLINLFSGQVADCGMQNPAAMSSWVTPTAAGNFTFRLIVPFELNRSGYCSLAAASQATPMQVQVTLNPLAASGQVYNAAPSNQTSQTIAITINQLFWGMNQGSVDEVHPDDLGASVQWTSAGGNQSPGANANTSVIAPTLSGWLTTLICVLRDSTSAPGPARVAALPASDITLKLDGVDVYSKQLYTEMQDKMLRNFAVVLGTDSAHPPVGVVGQNFGDQLTAGVACYTWRDCVTESVNAADTLDELIHLAPGSRLEVGGTFGSGGTPPYTLTYTAGVLVPTDNLGLPYTHLGY